MDDKKKMGRPTTNPKGKPIHVRLDDECEQILSDYMQNHNIKSRAEVIRVAIKLLK